MHHPQSQFSDPRRRAFQSDFLPPELTDQNRPFLTPGHTIDPGPSPQTPALHAPLIASLLHSHFKLIESPEDRAKKENALLKLNDILRMWMKAVNAQLGLPAPEQDPGSNGSPARLLCYGSYKLGVSTPQGDIDALVLAPSHVDREAHFFGTLFGMLGDFARDNENIRELASINSEHSITPLIKMRFYGVAVDLVFARLEDVAALDGQVSASGLSVRKNLANDALMREMDEKMKRSYNGFRNAEMILNSIVSEADRPDGEIVKRKIENYRMLLRCVKLLSKNNGLNENKFGFLGGIAYALLAAKVFQLYPNYSFPALLERFLYIYGFEWDWDKWIVRIVEEIPQSIGPPGSGSVPRRGFPAPGQGFGPTSAPFFPGLFPGAIAAMGGPGQLERPRHLRRFMTVFTPAWPQMNSTHNVTFSTREVILRAWREKHAVILKILAMGPFEDEEKVAKAWIEWFAPCDFFGAFEEFMQVLVVGREEAAFLKWRGFVEAKIRFLCERVEQAMGCYDFEMRIWPFGFAPGEVKVRGKYFPLLAAFPHQAQIFVGLRCLADYAEPIDLRSYIRRFLEQIEQDWGSENPRRERGELNLFVYLVGREEIESGEIRESESLGKREAFGVINDSGSLGDFKERKLNSLFLNTISSVTDNEEPDTERILDDLLD